MSERAVSKVCVIGLGSMGFGVALSLLRKGFRTSGYDIDTGTLERFAEAGGEAADSPAAAAKDADVVIIVVVNGEQTDAVLFGDTGAASTMAPGGTVLSFATMSPQFAEGLS